MRFRQISLILAFLVLVGALLRISRQSPTATPQAEVMSPQSPQPQATGSAAPAPPPAAADSAVSKTPQTLGGESLNDWVDDLASKGNHSNTPIGVVMPDGKSFELTLKPGGEANGIQGEVIKPSPGRFTFVTHPATGAVSFGVVIANDGSYAYRTKRDDHGEVVLEASTLSEVVCATDDGKGMPHPPGQAIQEIPAHPPWSIWTSTASRGRTTAGVISKPRTRA